MKQNKFRLHLWIIGLMVFQACIFVDSEEEIKGPYFGNGVHNGWADDQSIVLWTRLTETPDGNMAGKQFLELDASQHRSLRKSANVDSIYQTQIPKDTKLEDMIGACPGANGLVQLTYFPESDPSDLKVQSWRPVDPEKNFTLQWKLKGLSPNTRYQIVLVAKPNEKGAPSDTLNGFFLTASGALETKEIRFLCRHLS